MLDWYWKACNREGRGLGLGGGGRGEKPKRTENDSNNKKGHTHTQKKTSPRCCWLFVGCGCMVTCWYISGVDLLKQLLYMLPHWHNLQIKLAITQPHKTDTVPTSPSTDPVPPSVWQGSHWSTMLKSMVWLDGDRGRNSLVLAVLRDAMSWVPSSYEPPVEGVFRWI